MRTPIHVGTETDTVLVLLWLLPLCARALCMLLCCLEWVIGLPVTMCDDDETQVPHARSISLASATFGGNQYKVPCKEGPSDVRWGV